MTITRVPTPCVDELLCGIESRYYVLRKGLSKYKSVAVLYGGSPPKVTVALPSGINRLIEQFPPGHPFTADQIIALYTLFPLHKPYLPPERVEKIEIAMKEDPPKSGYLSTSSLACRIPQTPYFMYCPCCAKEERETQGFCYFHRLHHAPGVMICPKHRVWLESTSISTQARFEFIIAEQVVPYDYSPRAIDDEDQDELDLLAIAVDAMWLLEHDPGSKNPQELRAKYLKILEKQGLASQTGHVFTTKLIRAFKTRFSEAFLAQFSSQLEPRHKRNWLARIVQANQVQHPIRHLLLLRFLGLTASEFFSMGSSAESPFGDGPWLCRNPICTQYQQSTIQTVKLGISRSIKRRSLGTFECPCCGYTYSQTVSIDQSSKLQKPKVVRYGRVWDNRLRTLWMNPSVKIKEMCAVLSVGFDTIHRQAKRLDLPPRNAIANVQLQTDEPAQVEELENLTQDYHQEWLLLLQQHPNAALVDLMEINRDLYNHLLRFDVEWLNQHKPIRKQSSAKKVDWDARDTWLRNIADSVVQTILNKPGKPIRITMNSIAKEIGWGEGSIQRDQEELPTAYPYLLTLVESYEDFAIRRIWHIAKLYIEAGQVPTKWDFKKRAGLSPTVHTERVLSIVSEAIKVIQDAIMVPNSP